LRFLRVVEIGHDILSTRLPLAKDKTIYLDVKVFFHVFRIAL